jgi:hypothetical protein
MSGGAQPALPGAVGRLHNAINQHDLEAFLACFDPENGRIASGRLYMEDVEDAGADIDETVRRLAEGSRLEGE